MGKRDDIARYALHIFPPFADMAEALLRKTTPFVPESVYMLYSTPGKGARLPENLQRATHACEVQQVILECIGEDERSEIMKTIWFKGGYGL